MRIAVMQAEAKVLGIERNLDAIDQAAQRAAADDVKILLTPELFTVGYAPYVLRDSLDVSALPDVRERLSRIAAQHSIALVYSLPEVTDNGWLITSTFVDHQGEQLAHYQKVQLFGPEEHEVFIAGTNPPASFEYRGTTLGMVICFDVEFPEVVREASRRSVQLLLVPTAMGRGYEQVCTRLIPTRAMESQLFIAYANHSGTEAGFELAGTSVIAGADGSILAQGGPDAELLAADIDVSTLATIRTEVPYLAEARVDLYAQWSSGTSAGK
ncbi:nitrilase-related carbon-nitrogen hydrolase [Glutamicibacter sp. JC586]|uniref:nitrilase-related carbon-nitrogen hydrolase n=1 Tax=Glutamicibacter sp. JC586 TaxID=2590552 RepID=UPI00135C9DB9|nr:nitrilase-related carbon-nitrogen hydrolase [Glutamicibacter sp. JC586]